MADGSASLKGMREQLAAAAQAIGEERRNQSGTSPVPSSGNIKATTKPVIDGSSLRTDERQRLARERREEREKQNAAKESQMIEKEKKAKLQYEKQMEERQRKMEEQKLKEDQRRAAVEEKRKLKTEEEKERNEAVLRRTLERSQRMEQRQKRWSWGGDLPSDSESPTASKRSTSTSSLKQADAVINKRLSSSSATLPNSPDKSVKTRSSSLSRLSNKAPLHSQQPPIKGSQVEQKGGADSKRSSSMSRLTNKPHSPVQLEKVKNEEKSARRSQNSPLESNIISRLLAPTQASLARSKSAAALSTDGKDPPESHLCPRSASSNTTSTPVHTSKGPMRSRSIDRQKSTQATSVSSAEASSPESVQKSELGKQSPHLVKKRPPSPSNVANRRRSPSPANVAKRPPSPSTVSRPTQKNRPPSPILSKQRAPSTTSYKPAPIPRPSLTPSVISVTKKKSDAEFKPKNINEDGITQEPVLSPTCETEITIVPPKTKEESSSKMPSGTITAEEAAKNLAEKRRLAREQRERDDQERLQRAEEERLRKEEIDTKAAEVKVKREEELRILEEKRRVEEEDELKKMEEERIKKELEEQERLAELQQQKEEAEAKALEEAEKQKLEREKIMLQNRQERLERKKRIEEIMKRTRKTDQSDDRNEEKSDDQESEEIEDEDCISLEYTTQQGEINGVAMSQEITKLREASSETLSYLAFMETELHDTSKENSQLIFVNGDELGCNDKSNEESPLERLQPKDYNPTSKGNVQNSEIVKINEDNTIELVQNRNGKSSSWTFEEFIDLEVHSKSTKLVSDSVDENNCHQDLIDDAFTPPIPMLAFEEDGDVNLLTKSSDASSNMKIL